MTYEILPGRAEGTLPAPPSKSDAHRALICAALSERSTVCGIDLSDDVRATLSCLETLGAAVSVKDGAVEIGGLDPRSIRNCTLNCGESGSTLRFLIPLCLISGADVTLCGTEKLLSRPLDVYEELCAERGFKFIKEADRVTVSGKLEPGSYRVSGEKSSQFTTGLLLALSTLDGGSEVEVTGKAESLSYVNITAKVINRFGGGVSFDDGVWRVAGNFRPAPCVYTVEGDWSNAAFADALNFVGGRVKVTNLYEDSAQGDRVYPEMFEKIKEGEVCDLSDCPDLAPVLFALAACVGAGRFTGTARLRFKESDRAEAMKEELSAFGIDVLIRENEVEISGKLTPPKRPLSSHRDHRIAMALAVLCTVTGGKITGADAVSKSYPGFFRDLQKLGIEVSRYDA